MRRKSNENEREREKKRKIERACNRRNSYSESESGMRDREEDKEREKKQSFVCDNGNDDCYFNGISSCQLIKQEDIQQAHRLTTTATKANWIQNGISLPVHTIHNYLLLLLVFFSPSMSRYCYCSVCCYHRRKNFKLTLHQR